jgi:hypothetical protein
VTDTEILDWLEAQKAQVRYREYLPDNRPTYQPWWVCGARQNPFTGATLRQAVESARAQRALRAK